MENKENNIKLGKEIVSWYVPEYIKHERNKLWYILAIAAGLGMLVYAFLTSNFLFAVIIIIASLVIILNNGKEPGKVLIIITTEGIIVGKKFYDYDEIKDFSVIYKPRSGIKRLYFEFKSPVRQRLSFPLGDMNPLPIRDNLLKYLHEDLERNNEPLSESLAKLFRL